MDENNCDEETYFLCAQANDAGVDFLACMDATQGSAESKAKTCAAKSSLKWDSISSCFSGDQGATLKKNAALYFDKKFPGPIGVPHIEINGVALTDRSEATIIQALCATGIKAGVCKKTIVV